MRERHFPDSHPAFSVAHRAADTGRGAAAPPGAVGHASSECRARLRELRPTWV
ncbi:hypothetical protein KBY55_35605 [Streptomyces sp. b94]|uniref:hypothetical protein n=1 Tax=Streptomyces sp. b94 TaxID=1827634 RepID=UPI001B37382B|nr:hypothetical protein [Streptomyces sp. b94]MBQ1101227.1 hypothetical protein [Streptomyces sp. b94]